MSVTPVQAVGNDTAKVIQQYMQNNAQNVQSGAENINGIPSAVETPAEIANVGGNEGFVNSVADTVFTEIETLSSKLPNFGGDQSAVDAYKQDLVPDNEAISPVKENGLDKGKDDAVAALSKTFDHAIFMAMVNQVISGVGDTSRTLIRQT